jgi:hypothetical protein
LSGGRAPIIRAGPDHGQSLLAPTRCGSLGSGRLRISECPHLAAIRYPSDLLRAIAYRANEVLFADGGAGGNQ